MICTAFLRNAQKEADVSKKSVQECKLCHCGDGLCQNPPKKEEVVLHLKHNSRKEGVLQIKVNRFLEKIAKKHSADSRVKMRTANRTPSKIGGSQVT